MEFILLFVVGVCVVALIGSILSWLLDRGFEFFWVYVCVCVPVYIIAAISQHAFLPDISTWVWLVMLAPAIVIYLWLKAHD